MSAAQRVVPAAGVLGDRAQDAAHVRVTDAARWSGARCAAPSACPPCCSARAAARGCRTAPRRWRRRRRAMSRSTMPRRTTPDQCAPPRNVFFPQHAISARVRHASRCAKSHTSARTPRSCERIARSRAHVAPQACAHRVRTRLFGATRCPATCADSSTAHRARRGTRSCKIRSRMCV